MIKFKPLIVLLFLVISVSGIFLGKYQSSVTEKGALDSVSNAIQSAVYPVSTPILSLIDSVKDFTFGLFHAKALQNENQKLTEELKLLQKELAQNQSLKAQIDDLRALLKLKPVFKNQSAISADVIGYFPYENKITISKGEKDGVKSGLPLINTEGLVGIIQSVGEKRSQALLVTSPVQKIGAMVDRNPSSAGLLRGDPGGTLVLEFLSDHTSIEVNDLIRTSGFSDTVPKGIPIGRIVEIEENLDFGIRRARIFPKIHVNKLHTVYVLR